MGEFGEKSCRFTKFDSGRAGTWIKDYIGIYDYVILTSCVGAELYSLQYTRQTCTCLTGSYGIFEFTLPGEAEHEVKLSKAADAGPQPR
jgi:hypothetical protein